MTRHVQITRVAIAAALILGSGVPAARATQAATQPPVQADGAASPQTASSLQTAGSLQTIDTTSLADTQATMPAIASGTPAAAALVVQAHAEMLRPAPVPDQDFDAPGPSRQTLAAQEQARVQPSFYLAPRQNFSGDGFGPGSTLEDDHANRRRPGGGMSLSIPVP